MSCSGKLADTVAQRNGQDGIVWVKTGAVSARQRFRIAVAVVTACVLIPLAYSVIQHVTHRPGSPARAVVGTE